MAVIQTTMRGTVELLPASRIQSDPAPPLITASNVQDAIEQLAAGAFVPPAITPTPVNVAMSPYTVPATVYLLEVDTSGGAAAAVV